MKAKLVNFSRVISNFLSYLILVKFFQMKIDFKGKSFLYNKCYQYLYLYLYLLFYKKKNVLEIGTGYSTIVINHYISKLKKKGKTDINHIILEPHEKYFLNFKQDLSDYKNSNLKIISYSVENKNEHEIYKILKIKNYNFDNNFDFIYLDAPSPEWNKIKNLEYGNLYLMEDILELEKHNKFDLFIDGRYDQQNLFKEKLVNRYRYSKSYLGSFGLFKFYN